MSDAEEPIRIILMQPDVTGVCMDCDRTFTGQLGVRFVMICETRGIEVCIIAADEIHAIARVKCEDCPTVTLDATKFRHERTN